VTLVWFEWKALARLWPGWFGQSFAFQDLTMCMPKAHINPPTMFRSLDHGFSQAVITAKRRVAIMAGLQEALDFE
jgi:hypothetical protein